MKKVCVLVLALTVALVQVFSVCSVSAATATFPYNAKYAYGNSSIAPDQSAANQLIKAEWEDFKAKHVTSNGASGFKRIQRDNGTQYDTVSEGMGYGMILAVYMDEQSLFDDLYSYVKKYFNSNGVMGWRITAGGSYYGEGADGGATDADEDIAIALVFASKKWSNSSRFNYENEAKTLINNLYRTCVEQGTNVLKPGDRWGGSNVTNPSYFAPAWYRIFAQFTGNNAWNAVADKCYEIARNAMRNNNGTGLVPDWCTASGSPASGQGYDFLYDAVRYHWRAAIDYSWFGTEQAKSDCEALTNFYKKSGVANIKDGYTIQGNPVGQWHTATFVSMAAAAAMPTTDSSYTSAIYNEMVKVKDGGDYYYFGNSLRMMSLLFASGNFPNLYNYTPGQDPGNPGNKMLGDANGDGRVNSTDLLVVKQYILGITTQINTSNSDMNNDGRVNSIDLLQIKQSILGLL